MKKDSNYYEEIGEALENFVKVASITKGASFTIGYGSGLYRVSFPNQWVRDENGENPVTRVFKDVSPMIALSNATNWILSNRVKIAPVTKKYSLLE
jgi:hypothetical protein